MHIEISTLNVLLTLAIGLQCWMARKIMSFDHRLTRIETAMGLDTKFFKKSSVEK